MTHTHFVRTKYGKYKTVMVEMCYKNVPVVTKIQVKLVFKCNMFGCLFLKFIYWIVNDFGEFFLMNL